MSTARSALWLLVAVLVCGEMSPALAAPPSPAAAVPDLNYGAAIMLPGAACATECDDVATTGVFGAACGSCFLTSGLLTEPDTGLLQRYPLHEVNLTAQPALAVAAPSTYSATNFAFASLVAGVAQGCFDPMGDTEETNTLTICPPNTTDTSGCVTRQIGSTIDIAGQCISKQGWMTAIGTPACEGVEAAAPPTSFTTPEQLASLYPLKRNMSGVAPRARREANAMLTDATAAADSLWENAQNVFIQGAWFKNVTAEEVPRMQELYGADWTPALQALVDAGELIQMDFMMYEGMVTSDNNTAWAIAAHSVAQYRPQAAADGALERVSARVLAVRLSNAPDSYPNFTESAVYTAEKSPSAFALAMMALRSTLISTSIWPGHVYSFHQIQSAGAFALFNSIDPTFKVGTSMHPVRQMLDEALDPAYNPGFMASVFGGTASALPATPIEGPYVPRVHEAYANNGPLGANDPNTLYSLKPSMMANRSLLSADKFTAPGAAPWNLYPILDFQLRLYDVVLNYTTVVIDAFYASDADVKADAKVQAFARLMLAADGGNLRQITASNAVATRAELAEVTAGLLYLGLAHSTESLQDFVLPRVASMAHLPQRLMITALPDPLRTYETWEIVAAAPNNEIYSRCANFAMLFIGSSTTSPSFVPANQSALQTVVEGIGASTVQNLAAITEALPYLNPNYEGVPLTAEQAATAMQPYGGPRIDLSFNVNMLVVFLVFAGTAALQWAALQVSDHFRML